MSRDPDTSDVAPEIGELQHQAVRATLWTILQVAVSLPVAFAANIVVARVLGPHGYGVVASYMAAFSLVLVVLNGGISEATIQWGAAAYARGDRAGLIDLARRCVGYHVLVEGPLGALATAVILHRESLGVQVVAAVAVALTMALGSSVVTLTSISRTGPLARQALLIGVVIQAAIVASAFTTKDPGWVWAARLAAGVLIPALGVLLLPGYLRAVIFRPLVPIGWPDGVGAFAVRSVAAGLVVTVVFSRSEVLLLDAYGLAAGAGAYALAAGLAAHLTAPVDAILGPLTPAAASVLAIKPDAAGEAIGRGIRLSVLGVAPLLALALPALAALMPAIYGAHFSSAVLMFVALAMVSSVQSVLNPVTAFVIALRRPLLLLAVNAAALAVDLGLVVALVPAIGASAAVVANCVGQLLSLGLSIEIVHRHHGVPRRAVASAAIPLGILMASSLIGVGLAYVISVPPIAAAICGTGSAALVGWVGLRLLGGLVSEADLAAVAGSLPRALRALIALLRPIGLIAPSA